MVWFVLVSVNSWIVLCFPDKKAIHELARTKHETPYHPKSNSEATLDSPQPSGSGSRVSNQRVTFSKFFPNWI
jgi:hypothetical protein